MWLLDFTIKLLGVLISDPWRDNNWTTWICDLETYLEVWYLAGPLGQVLDGEEMGDVCVGTLF